ncbi:MAG: hypothetical protein QOI55_2926, partial [Actinomycetota bacterium]|nr:hypothetical protein [Actinomycetota bacterium]
GVISLVVVFVCWLPPLVDQFFGPGRGNLGALLSSAGNSSDPAVGYTEAPRLLATVATLPPFWFRPSFRNGWLQTPGEIHATPDLPSSAASVVSLAVLAVALALCVWYARRRRDTVQLLLVSTACLGLVIGFVTAGQAPLGFFGLPLHFFRWLWALSAFAFFAIVATVVRGAARTRTRSTALAASALVLAIVFAAWNLPTSDQGVAPPTYGIPVMRDVNRQLRALGDPGTVLVDIPNRFNEPYGFAVVAELQRRGVPFVVERTWARQVGDFRRFDGSNADNVLLIRAGDHALEGPRGVRRVAFHEGLSPADRRELDGLKQSIATRIRVAGLHLNARGREELPHGTLAKFKGALARRPINPGPLMTLRAVVGLVDNDYLVHDDWTARFARYSALQTQSDQRTLALFVEPLAAWEHT